MEESIKKLENNTEETIDNFKQANLAKKSVILTSSSIMGISVDSNEVNQLLNQADTIHSSISAKESTKNGYVEVEATDRYGIRHSTNETRAVKGEIDNVIDFVEACKSIIVRRRLKGTVQNENNKEEGQQSKNTSDRKK